MQGGDADKELFEYKKRELENFTSKVVVESTQFKVNTIISYNNNLDKYKPILEDSAKKVGIILGQKKFKTLTKR